jgi:hypothetical protein
MISAHTKIKEKQFLSKFFENNPHLHKQTNIEAIQ